MAEADVIIAGGAFDGNGIEPVQETLAQGAGG